MDERARYVLARLNVMCENDGIRRDLENMVRLRVPATPDTVAHPEIPTGMMEFIPKMPELPCVGFMGMLNGILGGAYIASLHDGEGNLVRFVDTIEWMLDHTFDGTCCACGEQLAKDLDERAKEIRRLELDGVTYVVGRHEKCNSPISVS